MKILMAFVNFHKHKIQNCFGQIKNMKDKIFSFQLKKNTSAKGDARLKNVPLPFI